MKNVSKKNIILLLFCAPALTVYILFKLYPAVTGMFYALTNWNGLKKEYEFIGLLNFVEIFSDHYFWNSVLFTFKYTIAMVIVSNIVALALAVAVESRRRTKALFRTVLYMPNMISLVIGGYMWMFILTKVFYYLADSWGWRFLEHSWIGNPQFSFFAIILVSSWGSVGFLMIIYMAALQGVPMSLKEAAAIDGASSLQIFQKIILPLINHAVTICIFWSLNAGFQVFDVIYTLTGGGPGRATQSVAVNIYEEAFRGNIRYGYATAKSTILFIIVLIITALQLNITGKRDVEI